MLIRAFLKYVHASNTLHTYIHTQKHTHNYTDKKAKRQTCEITEQSEEEGTGGGISSAVSRGSPRDESRKLCILTGGEMRQQWLEQLEAKLINIRYSPTKPEARSTREKWKRNNASFAAAASSSAPWSSSWPSHRFAFCLNLSFFVSYLQFGFVHSRPLFSSSPFPMAFFALRHVRQNFESAMPIAFASHIFVPRLISCAVASIIFFSSPLAWLYDTVFAFGKKD